MWYGDYFFIVFYLFGIFLWWIFGGEFVYEIYGGFKGLIIYFNWVELGKELWVGGIMLFYCVFLEYNYFEEKFFV